MEAGTLSLAMTYRPGNLDLKAVSCESRRCVARRAATLLPRLKTGRSVYYLCLIHD